MAQSIAKVIGADKREDGYLEGNGYIVSWCVGHLVELASPESYDEKYEKWRYDDLPILPFERLWISSMEDQAISDGFSHLKMEENMMISTGRHYAGRGRTGSWE